MDEESLSSEGLPHKLSLTKSTDNSMKSGGSESEKEFLLASLPNLVKKTKEDCTPLPDPFTLPTNFRPDVHLCLTNKKMTKSARAAFFSSVAAAMFQFKRYPSRDDYVSVARQIIGKYPFLGSTGLGASHVRQSLGVIM